MAEMAVQSTSMEAAAGPYDRAKALSAFKFGDKTFYWTTRACAIAVLLILGGIILSLAASPPVAARIGLDPFHFFNRHVMFVLPAFLLLGVVPVVVSLATGLASGG